VAFTKGWKLKLYGKENVFEQGRAKNPENNIKVILAWKNQCADYSNLCCTAADVRQISQDGQLPVFAHHPAIRDRERHAALNLQPVISKGRIRPLVPGKTVKESLLERRREVHALVGL
jgi:hypothetical protein